MEIKRKNRVGEFIKRFGVYIGAGVLVVALTITGLVIGLTGANLQDVDVSTGGLVFNMPMTNATVIKDFSNTELQENTTLGHWEAHLSMDLQSEDGLVYSVLDGTVLDVGYSTEFGNTVTIQHKDGFVSTYASLDKNILVAKDEKVVAGQKIGAVDNTAPNETAQGAHLHFTLTQNNKKVNPNHYIDFEKK